MQEEAIPTPIRYIPDQWLRPVQLHFLFTDPDRPLHVDVGSGKARFLLSRARTCPEVNHLGLERMLKRVRKTVRKAEREELKNLRVIRIDAEYAIRFLIPNDAVTLYTILFPDPWPKKRHAHHRLMRPEFLDALVRTMRPGGIVHFATDHTPYYRESMQHILNDSRFARTDTWVPTEDEVTEFERLFRDEKPIGRASFYLL